MDSSARGVRDEIYSRNRTRRVFPNNQPYLEGAGAAGAGVSLGADGLGVAGEGDAGVGTGADDAGAGAGVAGAGITGGVTGAVGTGTAGACAGAAGADCLAGFENCCNTELPVDAPCVLMCIVRAMEVIMNMMAHHVVAFDKNVAAPRGPNAV